MAHRHILFARCGKFREVIPTKPGRFAREHYRQIEKVTSSELISENSSAVNRIKPKKARSSTPTKLKHDKDPKQVTKRSSKKKKKETRSKKKATAQEEQQASSSSPSQSNLVSLMQKKELKQAEQKKKEEVEVLEVTVSQVGGGESIHSSMNENNNNSRIVVPILNCKYETYRRLLEYIYAGKYDISQTQAFELLPIAHEYKLEHLKNICAVKIQLAINIENVLHALILSHHCKADELKQYCFSFIAENRKDVTPALQKGELHPDLLKEVKKYLTVQRIDQLHTNTIPVYQPILS